MKITIDLYKRNFTAFVLTMLLVLVSLLFSISWYSKNEAKNQYLNITVNGTFLKRGYYEILSLSNEKKVTNIGKTHFTPCNGVQNISTEIPIQKNNETFIIQFSHLPSDSFDVNSVKIVSAYSDTTINIDKNYLSDINGNIIVSASNTDTKVIDQKVKNTFLILTPEYRLSENKSDRNDYMYALVSFIILFLFAMIFYKNLHLLSYSYIILSVIVFLVSGYILRDIGFRSLMFKKSSSSLTVELGMVIPYDDKIALYWSFDNSKVMNISEENKIMFEINGSNEIQNLSFILPDDKRIEKLRLYLGRLPFGNREIHYLRFKKNDMVIDIPPSSIPSFFSLLFHTGNFKLNNSIINIPINDQNSFIESQNQLTNLLEPLYSYKINRLSGYFLSAIISVLFFFWLFFSSITDKYSKKEKEITL